MFRTSRDAIQRIARSVLERLSQRGAVRPLRDDDAILQGLIQALTEELRRDEDRLEAARSNVAGQRRPPRPGSAEFDRLVRDILDSEYERLDLG
ncbi:MAG TPA: hypothetical protein VMS56_05950 [Thermoanaerobaculia bacterium]|nr:hypothetical protein [Thermoanaerobaculia bacterium]